MIGRILRIGGIFLFLLTIIIPVIWVILSSLKSTREITSEPWALPEQIKWINYGQAWNESNISSYFWNSLIVTSLTLLILIPISAMASYIFAKHKFKGSGVLFTTFLGGMMFPQFLVIIPLFLLMNQIQLNDTLHGLVLVYVAFSLPFTVFVLTGFFQNLPDELREAAMIDGASESRTFVSVMMPIARPGIIVALIFNIIGLWNEYNLALVLMNDPDKFTLPLGLANLTMTNQYMNDWGAMFAGMVIVMLPVMIVYWLLKEKIHTAMLAGAVKG